jgi:hypothetical protein
MVRDRRKYAFNPSKIRFHPNWHKLPTLPSISHVPFQFVSSKITLCPSLTDRTEQPMDIQCQSRLCGFERARGGRRRGVRAAIAAERKGAESNWGRGTSYALVPPAHVPSHGRAQCKIGHRGVMEAGTRRISLQENLSMVDLFQSSMTGGNDRKRAVEAVFAMTEKTGIGR